MSKLSKSPFVALCCLLLIAVAARAEDSAYLFAYFTGNGQDGLHLASSVDGLTWKALNNGRSVLAPEVGKDKLMRDPCVARGPDGTFHVVWTSGWWDNHIGHVSTKDFKTWSAQQSIPVMAQEPKVKNSWAPEVLWDDKRAQFLIHWASTVPGKFTETAGTSEDGLNHRIYSTTTKDWQSFTPTRLFYDPGYSVIDATIHASNGKFYLIAKDETRNPPKKHLRVAEAADVEGPWTVPAPPFSRDWVEGPTAIQVGKDTVVFFDVYREHHYGAMRSSDLHSWTDVTSEISVPKGARHGTMLTVARALVEDLRRAYPTIAAPMPRSTLNFNPGWRMQVGDPAGAQDPAFDDAAWKSVTLPHAWNEDDAFRVAIDKHPTGIAWYRKSFKLPAEAAGKKVFIEFEGVRQTGEVYINGKPVGVHENGVMAFGFDITEAVKPAPELNVIAVRTDNDWAYRERTSGQRYQWADKNFNANYGGIPKNVRLHFADRVYQTLPLYSHLGTTGVYVYATDFDIGGRSATVHAESEVRNEAAEARTFTYKVSLADNDGWVVAQFDGGTYTVAPRASVVAKASARVKDLNFWSWGYGYLYTVTTVLEAEGKPFDVVATRTGFRKTEFARGMVTLNDRVIQLKGYAQRTSNEWPAIGLSVSPWLSDFSNGLMVESGASLVRWMHVVPWKQDVESCDRVGLMQMMPAGDSEKDAQGRSWVQRTELMRDAIIYNRNNPSILVYESGNNGISEEHMAEMKAVRDRFDPFGGRAIGSRDMLSSKVAEYGGEMLYINKSARQPFWATEYSRDEGLRKYWDELSPPFHKNGEGPLYRNAPAREYNRNQDSHAIEDVVRWYDYWHERPGTGRRVNSGGVNIIFSDSNTHYRGAENYRRSGEVDAMRIPKDGFFAHQVMWDGWVNVEKPRAHILGHWNYSAGVKKTVTVVSSADAVELFLNGRSLGRGEQSSRFLFTFRDVAWEAGTLLAVCTDGKGAKICEARQETAGEPSALKLTLNANPKGFRADGADFALIQVEVVDAQGRRCPTALNQVAFELNGPAEWRGGIAQGPHNFILSKSLPVECGVNRVLIRSTPEAGRIVLSAKSAGLGGAQLELSSIAFKTQDGLSRTMPSEGLESRLGRGPTPRTPSFTVSRTPVEVASATAGSNAGAAALSYDDDETTAWTSGDDLATAWIEYRLERPATLNEATFKMSGWRERSAPIRILVDGQEVYRGATARSLGYVTLPLKPVSGQTVRVEMLEVGSTRDGFTMTEVEDQKNAATGAGKIKARSLSIIEAEFYEPLAAAKP